LLLPEIDQQLVGCSVHILVAIPTTLLAVLYILPEISQFTYKRRSTIILLFHIYFLYLVLVKEFAYNVLRPFAIDCTFIHFI